MTRAVFGAGGQAGQALMERSGAAGQGYDCAACDIWDTKVVARALSAADASVVINCAASSAVDRAEQEPEHAFAVNAAGAAEVAAALDLPIIYLSTDYVYALTGTAPQSENIPMAPLNVYGASKAAGDAAVAAVNPAHLLLRVSWVFGVHGTNFVKTMLRLGREHPELRVVDDQLGGPTEPRDIADAILVMVAARRRPGFNAWGTYHFAGAPSTSWYGFTEAIFARSRGPRPSLVRIMSRDYPTLTLRPLNSTLDCTRIAQVFGIKQPDWRRGLSPVIAQLDQAVQ